ncbi:conjugative transposon protein TraM [Aquipluma nitroreducens]|uniref:Conjugative transposon protein TraM n=1 Tax=Aquipluma nitroreducens TaxID=2010828 RepID=A0A5K7S458_9BACT|nr:conjugative transposon protein TraM [Aquipluma nitroreducens]BBE16306.1 conjugative transposon protein TraM [Aquipluma nitroreducens]
MKSYLKRNKPLLFLPLVLIPFIVLIFYVLGGGEKKAKEEQKQKEQQVAKGANYTLPDADKSVAIYDKMDNYSSKKEVTTSHDYNIAGETDSTNEENLEEETLTEEQLLSGRKNLYKNDPVPELNADVSTDLMAHIRQKERTVREDLENSQTETKSKNADADSNQEEKDKGDLNNQKGSASIAPTGIEELDKVFRQNSRLAKQNDSLNIRLKETTSINEKLEAEKNKRSTLEKGGKSEFKPKDTAVPVIEAEVYETTTVLTGNRVKLRLLEEAWLNGVKIPANTFLYGICEVSNERLQIEVLQIPVVEKFVPVQVTVCDLDGLPGLYVPDNASRKVAKEVGSSANTSSMFGASNNPLTYMGMQAADKTAQSILRMIKIKKVTIKKNTLVYLINKSK